ncbi:Rod shape determining protein RodA OS=Ureibacillus acetophenoni OX=614649 GN=SAMN05877842_111135 PE=4 SV=1 [Ureibacillus acetophenoni]
MDNERNLTKRLDWPLIIILFAFLTISLLAISSAQTTGQYAGNFVFLQFRWYVIGAVIIAFVMYFEPDQYKKMSWYLYGLGILLLFVLIFMPEGKGQIGEPINGAKSWYRLPGLGSIQPAEFMKTFYILASAHLISKHHEKYSIKSIKTDLLLLVKIAITLFIPLAFIMLQPDLGSSLVFLAITAALVIVAGISWKIILPIFAGFCSHWRIIVMDGCLHARFFKKYFWI